MLVVKNNDILNADENIICHQVNIAGAMGGGLAKQIAKAYPDVEKKYENFCKNNFNSWQKLKGENLIVKINNERAIANCFTQRSNYDTDYLAIWDCFSKLLAFCKNTNKTIAVPFKYGCGIANGDWAIVSNIFDNLSNKYNVIINVYKKEEEK